MESMDSSGSDAKFMDITNVESDDNVINTSVETESSVTNENAEPIPEVEEEEEPNKETTIQVPVLSESEKNEYTQLLQRKQKLLQLKRMLKTRLDSLPEKSPLNTKLLDQDKDILNILFRNKLELSETSTKEDFLMIEDRFSKFSVMPISHDPNLRNKIIKKFTSLLKTDNEKVDIIEETNERTITYDLESMGIFKFKCQVILDHNSNQFKSFKILNYNKHSINSDNKSELSSLMDISFFTLINNEKKSFSSLNFNELYNLELYSDKDFNVWLYTLNSYSLICLKRGYLFLQLVYFIHENYPELLIDQQFKIICLKARNALRVINSVSLIHQEPLFTDYNDKFKGIDDDNITEDELFVNRLLHRLAIPELVSWDDYFLDSKIIFDKKDLNSLFKAAGTLSLQEFFSGYKTIGLSNEKFVLKFQWSLQFINETSTDSIMEPLLNEEASIRFGEPKSNITVTLEKLSENDFFPEEYNKINETLTQLIEQKGVFQGIVLLIETFYKLKK